MIIENFEGYFLITCLLIAGYLSFLLFAPFLPIIILAMVVTVVCYPVYSRIKEKFKNHDVWASLLMCLLVVFLIVVPSFYFILALKDKSLELYNNIQEQAENNISPSSFWETELLQIERFIKAKVPFLADYKLDWGSYLVAIGKYLDTYIISTTTAFIKGTTSLMVDIVFFFLTLFYLFKDGHLLGDYIMRITPLSNKYDRKLFKKFTDVSISAIVSTLVVTITQGVATGIGLLIVGIPAFFGGVVAGFFSLIPLVGASVVWLPIAIYLFLSGRWIAGLFLLIYGVFVISLIDNVLRAWIMQGHTEVHPLLVLFSILGGVSVFGFTGIIFGPLILTLLVTLLHIYMLEYDYLLEKR